MNTVDLSDQIKYEKIFSIINKNKNLNNERIILDQELQQLEKKLSNIEYELEHNLYELTKINMRTISDLFSKYDIVIDDIDFPRRYRLVSIDISTTIIAGKQIIATYLTSKSTSATNLTTENTMPLHSFIELLMHENSKLIPKN